MECKNVLNDQAMIEQMLKVPFSCQRPGMHRRGLETRRLVEVARLYYESHFTQAKIARLLKLSRPGVQRVLRRARELGIVTITIADPLDVLEAVGRDLQEAFGLDRVIVVPTVRGDADATKAQVGEAGARCLEALLKDSATLAVAWGTTVREVARALHSRRITGLRVVQMVGELGLATEASETFRAIADRLSGQAIALPAPAMEKNLAVRRSMLQSAHIREVFRILREATIALTGVGPVASEATIVRRGHVTPEVMRDLAKQGAVGEINTKFFDRQGRPLRAINAQIIGMDLEDIKRIPKVVAVVSGGPGKASAVLGAIRGKYIDILVIDEALASRVLATNLEEEAAIVGAG
jgi:DNA-binding transcriptional regulator LsrR (DeoR family)